MRLAHKIGLIGGVPLIIMAVIFWQLLAPKMSLLKGSTRWDASVQVMQACSNLIHVLQIERGSTAVYLKGGDSSKMANARNNVDKEIGQFETSMARLKISDSTRSELMAIPAGIRKVRGQVQSGAKLPRVFAQYTDLVETMVERIQKETQQKTNKGVGKRLLTLATLEEAKENAGRFRAHLASTVAADAPIQSQQIVTLAREKERASAGLESPILVLDGNNKQLINELIQSPCWKNSQERYSVVLGKSQSGNYGLDSGETFDDMTKVINSLHEVLSSQMSLVRARTLRVHSEAQTELIMWVAGLLVAFCGSMVLTVSTTRRLTNSMNAAVDMAQGISRGDTDQQMSTTGNDELTSLSKALNAMSVDLRARAELAERIANRDLDVQVQLASEDDLLGHALRRMVRTLHGLISHASDNSTSVMEGAREIADSSQALSQGATEQAATLEEISASITEVSDHTRENAANAHKARDLTQSAQEAASQGIVQMDGLVASMEEINASSQQIGAIIKTVDNIAFQTNLLALNAAVEAARAGAHGKGFAVVADEVRNLAGRSAKAARETSQLVEDSYLKVEQGAKLADTTAKSFHSITQEVSRAAGLVDEIAAAASEQANSVTEISEGLNQVDSVIQQSSASAEQLASSSEMLFAQSQDLSNQLDSFNTGQGDQSTQEENVGSKAGPMENLTQEPQYA